MQQTKESLAKIAFRFVLIIGIVNFFADVTYEGARANVGPFLRSLGASATIVGFVAGFGELVGYGLRSISGFFADKTHKYWFFTFLGYAVNMLAVPGLALAGNWPVLLPWWLLRELEERFASPQSKPCSPMPANRSDMVGYSV